MRPFYFLLTCWFSILLIDAGIYVYINQAKAKVVAGMEIKNIVTSGLGLTDLCVATEARYTRHPAVSDPMAPFMDHPGAVEHFPTGSFWISPQQ